MSRFRRLCSAHDGLPRIVAVAHLNGREPHQRSVAGSPLVARTGERVSGPLEAPERRAHGVANVETVAGSAAPISLVPPADVEAHLIDRIESVPLDKALGQAQGHRRIVGPLARPKAERPAADHIGDRLESPFRAKLEGRAKRVADGEPDQTADVTIEISVHFYKCQKYPYTGC